MSNKFFKIASLSFVGQSLRIITGPITLLIISKNFTSEQLSFYFTFFNIVSIQVVLELGFGFTLKQFIAHSYENKNTLTKLAKLEIKSYSRLVFLWFSVIFLALVSFVNVFGFIFYSSYAGTVDWQGPWVLMILSAAISSLMIPLQVILEGCQKQVSVYKAKLISGLAYSTTLWFSILYLELDLYSIGIAGIASSLVFFLIIINPARKLYRTICSEPGYALGLKESFSKVFPMLSRMSVTWGSGYLFWNSFGLIAFHYLGASEAGKFSFTLGLAHAGYMVCQTIVSSQTTAYSNLIAKKQLLKARALFNRYAFLSFSLMVTGYFSYYLLNYFLPDLFIFEKTMDINNTIYIFLYYLMLLPVVLQANFCRCFKEEPFMKVSVLFNSIIPVVFFLSINYLHHVSFLTILPLVVIMNIIVRKIYLEFLSSKEESNNYCEN